ncbi:hypothetical protein K501DRAFT_152370, partial [Backusella circina FSU 941]
ILFVGDRGYGVGSRIKGFLKYGGKWKPKKHTLYTSVCITNENNTSQTCPFCFGKLSHPTTVIKIDDKKTIRSTNGTFVCHNPKCISVKTNQSHHNHDHVSALVISPSSLGTLVLEETFPKHQP